MSTIIERMQKARETKVPLAGFTFTVRRPTELEMFELRGNGSPRRVLPFVVGWEGVKESDLINGGDPHPVPFDPQVAAAWLEDREDLMWPLTGEVLKTYTDHTAKRQDAAKN